MRYTRSSYGKGAATRATIVNTQCMAAVLLVADNKITELQEDLEKMHCSGFLDKPQDFWDADIVQELLVPDNAFFQHVDDHQVGGGLWVPIKGRGFSKPER